MKITKFLLLCIIVLVSVINFSTKIKLGIGDLSISDLFAISFAEAESSCPPHNTDWDVSSEDCFELVDGDCPDCCAEGSVSITYTVVSSTPYCTKCGAILGPTSDVENNYCEEFECPNYYCGYQSCC